MSKKSQDVIFMGTSRFGAIILEGLCRADMRPVLVVTAPDKPVGRKQTLTSPPVKVIAQKYDIQVLQPEKMSGGPTSIQIGGKSDLLVTKPDLIVVAAYGQILPKEILEIPKHGCLNIHPSLLPKYRGATPVQSAILNGDKETGVTIMLMDEQIDHGPIIAQKKTAMGSNETYPELHERLAELGAELLIDTIPDWTSGKIKLEPQDEKRASYVKILTREDGEIDWKKSPQEIDRQIRALNPWPGTYMYWERDVLRIINLKRKVHEKKRIRLKILKARLERGALIIEEVQLEGKKPMTFEDFMRGYSDFKMPR